MEGSWPLFTRAGGSPVAFPGPHLGVEHNKRWNISTPTLRKLSLTRIDEGSPRRGDAESGAGSVVG